MQRPGMFLVLALCAGLAGCALSHRAERSMMRGIGPGASGVTLGGDAGIDGRSFGPVGRERYAHNADSPFIAVADAPLSTFSADVDTGAYSNTRRFLNEGTAPPVDAVRVEELVNYFDYAYPEPAGTSPLAAIAEVADCPWNSAHRLVHIGIQGKHITQAEVPPRNLVFLVDVSGSMESADKLPLLRRGLLRLADDLRQKDHVAIVVYAGASGVALAPTNNKTKIRQALQRLKAGGSTNGSAGIELAYEVAGRNFKRGAVNRVILATDGDFNVGPSSDGELVRLIEEKRKSGVYLSVLGFGQGNYNESAMEQIADRGNGNYAYIDSYREATRVLVDQANSTLVPIADDVKLQVEFNPAQVEAYRLIGYENRELEDHEFNDDATDAGDVGAGHTVTALYEVVPAGTGEHAPKVDPLLYQSATARPRPAVSADLMTVKIRYKRPGEKRSQLASFPVRDSGRNNPSEAFRFSAAVASFGMLLRDSPEKGSANFEDTLALAKGAVGSDPSGARREFLKLVKQAARLAPTELKRAR